VGRHWRVGGTVPLLRYWPVVAHSTRPPARVLVWCRDCCAWCSGRRGVGGGELSRGGRWEDAQVQAPRSSLGDVCAPPPGVMKGVAVLSLRRAHPFGQRGKRGAVGVVRLGREGLGTVGRVGEKGGVVLVSISGGAPRPRATRLARLPTCVAGACAAPGYLCVEMSWCGADVGRFACRAVLGRWCAAGEGVRGHRTVRGAPPPQVGKPPSREPAWPRALPTPVRFVAVAFGVGIRTSAWRMRAGHGVGARAPEDAPLPNACLTDRPFLWQRRLTSCFPQWLLPLPRCPHLFLVCHAASLVGVGGCGSTASPSLVCLERVFDMPDEPP